MNDVEIEKVLLEKKIISKKDIELIRKQAIGNNISFKTAIEQLKRISLGMLLMQLFLVIIGINILLTEDSTSFIAYAFAFSFGIIVMNIVAPITLGAKLFFISFKNE